MFLDPQVLKKVFDVFGVFFRNFSSGQCYVSWSWNIVLMVGIFKIFRKTGLFCNILGCVMNFFKIKLKVGLSREPCIIEAMLLLYT